LSLHSILATLVLILAVWAASGFYKVQPDQVGLVLRFGRWVDTRQPGLNYHLPYPIEFALLPKVTAINQLKIGNGAPMQMLTGDENIVEATASISWRIKDPVKFLFNVNDPEGTVKMTGESAVRQIIGLNPIMGLDLVFGQNDSFVLGWIVFSLWFAHHRRFAWSALFFGIACASKPTAWFLAPFWALALLTDQTLSWRRLLHQLPLLLRRAAPALVVFLVLTLPYVLWNANAFVDDVWRWAAGTGSIT